MTTRFSLAAFLLAVALLTPSARAAAPAGDAFQRNRDAILTADALAVDGHLYFVGRALSEDGRGSAVGFGKARALAWARLDRWLLETSPWPSDATDAERMRAWRLLRQEEPEPQAVAGAETVREERTESGRWLVVLSIPETTAASLRPSEIRLQTCIATARAQAAVAETDSSASPESAGGAMSGTDETPDDEPAEPRGLWVEDGVTANETMSTDQF